MAAITGAIRLDNGPVDRTVIGRMEAALAHRGRCSTLQACGSGPRIAFHGRIDNRAEVARLLRAGESCGDAALALAAYAAWGDGCAARLLGDFAFAIWNPAERLLLCVRDVVGVKPFFYAVADGTFLFASELHALFRHPALPRQPNEGMIAEFLNGTVTSRDETLFSDVRRLPPAHLLRVQDGLLSLRRYWTPAAAAGGVRRSAEDDYAAELKMLLREAVDCRIDGVHAGAQLSGGLDSSAIAAIAAARPNGPAVHTYSLVFPGRSFDESGHIADVVRRLGVRNTAVDAQPWDADWFARETGECLECPLGPTAGVLTGLFAAVRGDGFASMLTGEGADEWFSGSVHHYADLVARGAVREVAAEILHAPHRGAAVRRLVLGGIWPLVPAPLRPPIRAVARRVRRTGSVAEWLDPAFARSTSVADRSRRPEYDRVSGMSRSTWDIAQYLVDGTQALAFEIADRLAARWGIEERHPFYDRRVIEFALALPESQRAARGVRKRVLRNAVAGLLPDSVRQRADKADFSGLYVDWFAAVGGARAFDRLAIAEAGWVRRDVLVREYRRANSALVAGRDAPEIARLWAVVAIDAWFKAAIAGEPQRAARVAVS